jgi:3',5'-cyclic AMP phosphodiesterase CpdA
MRYIFKRGTFLILILFLLGSYASSMRANDKALSRIKNITQKRFSFAFLGDNRGGLELFKTILKKINRDENISFIINGGDLVSNGYEKQYKDYLSSIEVSKKPIISVIGNHEVRWIRGREYFEKYIGDRYFSFSVSSTSFTILDNSNLKTIDREEYIWLEKRLKESIKFKHHLLFMHTPLYDPREGYLKRGHSMKNVKEAKKLNLLLKKYGVSLVLASHIHSFFEGSWRGVKFIISGGAGAPLYEERASYHYVKVDIDLEKVSYKVVPVDLDRPPKWRSILRRVIEYLNI